MEGLVENKLNTKWIKAAIIGSTWAAFEIIVGSFLHNLRIPFAGTMLSMASVFLLISFIQIWKERGIIIRAGLICALMKSISPSAMILGPMIGIFMEALIIESLVLIFGRNLFVYMASGSIAVFWALLQKVLSLLITYGFNIIKIAKSFYLYLVKISGLQHISGEILLIGIVSIYLVFGALSGYLGFVAGRRYKTKSLTDHKSLNLNDKQRNEALNISANHKYSLAYLWIIIAAIAVNLYLVNTSMHIEALITGSAFMAFCLFRYRNAVKILKKPAIWIQFTMVTIIAAVLWDWLSTGIYFSEKGLIVGLEMNYRALIVIFGFSSIGVELRNPLVKSLLYKRGFSKIHDALSLGFSSLPAIIESLPKPKKMIRHRKEIIEQILSQSIKLLEHFEKEKSYLHNNR